MTKEQRERAHEQWKERRRLAIEHKCGPCPFCGDDLLEMNGPGGFKADPDCYVQCMTCTSTGPNGADFESAAIQWNTRGGV
jgi:hypothetical protein